MPLELSSRTDGKVVPDWGPGWPVGDTEAWELQGGLGAAARDGDHIVVESSERKLHRTPYLVQLKQDGGISSH